MKNSKDRTDIRINYNYICLFVKINIGVHNYYLKSIYYYALSLNFHTAFKVYVNKLLRI